MLYSRPVRPVRPVSNRQNRAASRAEAVENGSMRPGHAKPGGRERQVRWMPLYLAELQKRRSSGHGDHSPPPAAVMNGRWVGCAGRADACAAPGRCRCFWGAIKLNRKGEKTNERR